MNEDAPKMSSIPVVTETSLPKGHLCNGCGAIAVHFVSFRVSDTQQQILAWCNQCAGIVMNFLEERVLRAKEVGYE